MCSFCCRFYFDANRRRTSSSECIFDFLLVVTHITMSISFSYFILELVSYISQIYIHALNLATVCVKTAGLKVHPIARASNPFPKSQQQMGSCYLGKFRKSQMNKNICSHDSWLWLLLCTIDLLSSIFLLFASKDPICFDCAGNIIS